LLTILFLRCFLIYTLRVEPLNLDDIIGFEEHVAMQLTLPDIGDLLVAIALLFTALIVLFETLESRRRGQREQRILEAIEEEYRTFCRLGRW
jgi:hypothetical protein